MGQGTEQALGGGLTWFADSLGRFQRTDYGEATFFRKGEVRNYNFQVANTFDELPSVKDLLDVLRFEHYFPSHYLHTGKYLIGRVPDVSKERRQKKWIVLDPSDDPKFKLNKKPLERGF